MILSAATNPTTVASTVALKLIIVSFHYAHVLSITISIASESHSCPLKEEVPSFLLFFLFRDGLKFYLYLAHSCQVKLVELGADPVA